MQEHFENEKMKRFYRITRQSLVVGAFVALFIAAYLSFAPEGIVEEIRAGVTQENIEIGGNEMQIGSYKPESDPFKTFPVDNLSFFKKEKMDRVFATAKYDDRSDKIWLLVRGIKYADLPYVYDFYREFEKPYNRYGYIYYSDGARLKIVNKSVNHHSLYDAKNVFLLSQRMGGYDALFTQRNVPDADEKKISIVYSRTKYNANVASFILLGGILTSTAIFIILINRPDKIIKSKDQ